MAANNPCRHIPPKPSSNVETSPSSLSMIRSVIFLRSRILGFCSSTSMTASRSGGLPVNWYSSTRRWKAACGMPSSAQTASIALTRSSFQKVWKGGQEQVRLAAALVSWKLSPYSGNVVCGHIAFIQRLRRTSRFDSRSHSGLS